MIYKVLLVDDEYYIRQRLKTCIEWEEEGFEIAAEAQSADDALSILKSETMDMSVVDISMPQKDGLTLIKELRDLKINVKIMILSGYGTFAYAQKAIEYGVTQYLLKPIEEEELIQSLRLIRKALDSEYSMRDIRQSKRRADYLLTTIRKENYFKKICTNHPLLASDKPALEPQMESCGLTPGAVCQVLVFDLHSRHLQALNREDLHLFRYAADNILCEIAQSYFRVTSAADIFGHGVLICGPDLPESKVLSQYMEAAADKVRELLKLDICFGCSCPFPMTLPLLNAEYRHALSSYVLCNLRGCTSVSFGLTETPVTEIFEITEVLERIDTCFSSGHEKELGQSIDALFSLLEQRPYPFFFLEQTLSRCVMICGKSGSGPAIPTLSDDLSYLMGFKEILFAGYDMAYLREKITGLFFSMLATQQLSSAGNVKETLVEDAVRFIDEHYARCDMSLTLLSQNLLVSPSYLSSMFKKIKGISINQYLTQSRLRAARELLSETGLTLTEIAERVGYNDIFYFSKVFKRHYGVSPSSCRQAQ